MAQLVFLHGPGAGACADAFHYQLQHFTGSVAPTLPGHLQGIRCPDVARYTEWVRGWLWSRGLSKGLVLVGYTLGASIALQYGLDYPDEVKGLVVMTVAARPKTRPPGTYEMRLRAAEDPKAYDEWLQYQRHAMKLVEPGLRERLLERHRQIGPLSQYHDLKAIDAFDVRDRLATLKPIREALGGGALSAHRDSRQGQRADRGIRRRAVRKAMIYHVHFVCAPDYMARRLPFRPAHLKQLASLRDDGRVVAGGPEPDGTAANIFYRVVDRAELDRLLAENEFNRAGLFTANLPRAFADFVEPRELPPVDAGLSAIIVEGAPGDRAKARAVLTALQREGRVAFGGFFEDGAALAVVRSGSRDEALAWLTRAGWDPAGLVGRDWSQTL